MTKQQSDQALGSLAWMNPTCQTRELLRGALDEKGQMAGGKGEFSLAKNLNVSTAYYQRGTPAAKHCL